MNLNQKEMTLLKDLRSQEQLCVEKYTKYASDACDPRLKNLFTNIAQTEQQHLQTLDQIASGVVPSMNGGGGNSQPPTFTPSDLSPQNKQQDSYLCQDALSTEKHVSASYNTCIFEFTQADVRDALNHIQKEEQQHGEALYNYMSANNMYA